MMNRFFNKKRKEEEGQQAESESPSSSASTIAAPEDTTMGTEAKLNQIDPVIEKRMVRKLDWHIIPLLGWFWMLCFLDRGNIGNARIAGMAKDLKLTSNKFDWLLTIFYIFYITFSFTIVMFLVVKPHQWAAFAIFFWGLISTCQAAAQNWGGMMALRTLLGVAEAGFSPAVPFILSSFYNRKEIGLRVGLWGSTAPLASCFSGLLAYAITSGYSALTNWRLLFLVEGLPTVLSALLAWYFLPDNQASAKFLTEEEREVARLRMEKQHGKTKAHGIKGSLDLKEMAEVLRDPVAWCNSLIEFSVNVSFAAIAVFLPTIISEFGRYGPVASQGLSAPPFFFSIIMIIITTWIADKTQQRGLVLVAMSLLGGAGYVMLAVCKGVHTRYAAVFLAVLGGFSLLANVLAWAVNNQGTSCRRLGGFIFMNTVGQCGALLGTRMFPLRDAPYYVKGQGVCAGFMFFAGLLALVSRTYMARQNRKWDEQYGPRVERGDMAGIDDEGDENYGRNFRYVL